MAKRIEKLTPEQEAQIPIIRDEFLRIGLSTEPADFDTAELAVKDAYAVAGLEPPKLFIRLASPHEGAIGAAILKDTHFGKNVWDQVRAQVRAQVWAQVRDQVRDQVWAQVWAQVRDQVGAQVWAAYWSQHDAGWLSFFHFFANAAGLDDAKRLEPLTRIARNCGWVWFFAGAVIMTDRPRVLRRDDQNRLHCEDGPALEYRDGFAIHAWHGTRVPAEWITDKDKLTPTMALTWENVDQRAAACEILGWHKIIDMQISNGKGRLIDEDADPQIGRLVEIDLPDHGPQKFIHAMCGTGREVAVMADAKAKTVIEAQAASYGLAVNDFLKPEVRT